MARVQFTFTFTNAQPGAHVGFSSPVYPSATGTVPDGPRIVLSSTNSVTVWSDAAYLIATTTDGLGVSISATATRDNPTVTDADGTAGVSPFLNLSTANGTFVTVVAHGSTAGMARPSGAVRVLWRGTVQPTNMAVGDIYEDISTPTAPTQKIATSIGPIVLASLGGGSSATIDKPGVYIPTGSLPALKAALPATASQLVEVTYFGDSTGFGNGGDGGPVRKLRSLALAAGLTDGGRGVASPNETASSSGESLAPLVARTGFGTVGASYDFLNSDTFVSSAAGNTITYTGKGTCVRIVYTIAQGSTGRFTYAVDGGSAVTVDASTATDGATLATLGVVYVSGLSEGTHTVVITNLGDVPIAAPPGNPVISGSNSGGTLAGGTYYYKNTVVTAAGETTAGPSYFAATAGGAGSMSVTPLRVAGAVSYNIYRGTSSGGTFGLVGNLTASGAGTYNAAAFTDTGFTPGVAPPSTNTAGASGTTYQARPVVEFIRTTGVVFHKQAISGIGTTSYFDATRSASATQPNVPAQVALGLKTGISSTPNSSDWGQTTATKPTARNVKAAIFALGLNDCNVASETAFQSALANSLQGFALFVKMCRAAGADPILVVEHFDYYNNAVSSLYGDRLRQGFTAAARSYGVAYVDYNVALGPVATSGVYSGAPHLVQAAYDTEGTYLWTELFAKALAGTAG